MAVITSFENLPLVIHVKDLAKILSISQNTACADAADLTRANQRIGRTYRIPKDAVLEYLNKS